MSDERVNAAIDEVARLMTAAAAPTGADDFRRRALARIGERPRRTWTIWTLAPIAAVALIVLAMLVTRSGGDRGARRTTPQVETTAAVRQQRQPTDGRRPTTPDVAASQAPTTPGAARRSNGTNGAVVRTSHAAADPASPSEVAALAPPPIVSPALTIDTLSSDSLSVEGLATPARIAIAPLATPQGEPQ